jgi:hypothetical protein
MKNNYAMKTRRPDSFTDDDKRWPQLPPGMDSMADPAKILTEKQKAESKQQEAEAYERFLKNRNRMKPTATGLKE